MKYFKPKSLTWWASVAEITLNVLRAFGYEIPKELDGLCVGAFGIGIRAKLGKIGK